ncbi:exosome complex component RRP46-like isoform X2 [Amphiura filiformis]|uniref:exosome complex component RRP46-like isoform X2 n=1 Tax=Amphiura filiformis TaxID=82378 RepID=UPI003B21CCCE
METDRDTDTSPELRPVACEQSFLSRPDGSATFTQGDTSVMAAVYGPADVNQRKEILDKATVEVVLKNKVGFAAVKEKAQERLIRNSCATVILTGLHPRTSVTIVLQIIQDSGSLLSCCINAACLALLDAGVPMKCLMASVTCVLDKDGDLFLDPTEKQAKVAQCMYTFAFESQEKKIITSTMKGTCTTEQYQSCLAACQTASQEIFNFYRTSAEKKLSKS